MWTWKCDCPYLIFHKYGSETVEELEGRDDVTLHED